MENQEENKEQDRYLPIANIGRIMKQALPKDAKIAKEARETVQECVSEFISFITSEACDKCKNDKRKTINGDDLVYSLYQLGFERYLENLNIYYQKYKEAAKQNDKTEHSAKNNEQLVNSAQEAVQQTKFAGSGGGTQSANVAKPTNNKANDGKEEEGDDQMKDEEQEEDEGMDDEEPEEEEESEEPSVKVKSQKAKQSKAKK